MLRNFFTTKVGIATGIALVLAGGSAVFAASNFTNPYPPHAGEPAPRTFPHITVPIPKSGQPVPAGLTTAVTKTQAIHDALTQVMQQDPSGSPTVISAVLVSKTTAEAEIGSVSPLFPDYFWKVGLTGAIKLSEPAGTYSHVFVFVDAQTGHPWIIWVPPLPPAH
ncbi:MAG: hypothetical protein C7B47_15440 [Sulfobacillus thermosulfidooxidans]|uniref:Uncharacterized protein n=1 Tax=Sulfobacillus thermosulfidooxidans TaxID=28034 RepID=A0A2T2WP75_SULTH|nr:MAG: hypothetical protein C7B47_15440 [Sulfobacillus thermosulfidooxidans]